MENKEPKQLMSSSPSNEVADNQQSELTWRDLDGEAAAELDKYEESMSSSSLSAYPLPGYEQLDCLAETTIDNVDQLTQSMSEAVVDEPELSAQDTLRKVHIGNEEGVSTLNFAMDKDGMLRWLGESDCMVGSIGGGSVGTEDEDNARSASKGAKKPIELNVFPFANAIMSHLTCNYAGAEQKRYGIEMCKRQFDELKAHLDELRKEVCQMPGIDCTPEQQREQLALLQKQLKSKRDLLRKFKDMRF